MVLAVSQHYDPMTFTANLEYCNCTGSQTMRVSDANGIQKRDDGYPMIVSVGKIPLSLRCHCSTCAKT
jgi:hypothetical protein